jgi:hypothetical protein
MQKFLDLERLLTLPSYNDADGDMVIAILL